MKTRKPPGSDPGLTDFEWSLMENGQQAQLLYQQLPWLLI